MSVPPPYWRVDYEKAMLYSAVAAASTASASSAIAAPAPMATRHRIHRIELYLESVKDYSPPGFAQSTSINRGRQAGSALGRHIPGNAGG